MAIIGGAVFTPIISLVFQATRSMAIAMLVPLTCYFAISTYAFWGSKLSPLGDTDTPALRESES
jgi:MFS transporter, FHS family, L-fucose permease